MEDEIMQQVKKQIFWNGEYWETTNGHLYSIYAAALAMQLKIERDRRRAL